MSTTNITTKNLKRLGDLLQKAQAVYQDMLSEGSPSLPPAAQNLLEQGICLRCKAAIGKSKRVRGCHEACAKAVKDMIRRGELTEYDAITGGAIAPAGTGGRPPKHPTAHEIQARASTDKAAEDAQEMLQDARKLAKKIGKKTGVKPERE